MYYLKYDIVENIKQPFCKQNSIFNGLEYRWKEISKWVNSVIIADPFKADCTVLKLYAY